MAITVALNSPADTATAQLLSPVLNFTGTDSGGNDLTYNVQVATDSSFGVVSKTNLINNGATNNTSFTTASITPGANKLLLALVVSSTSISTNPNIPSLTGNGLTWVQVDTINFDNAGTSRRRMSLFRAMGSSPSAGAVTISFSTQTQTNCLWIIDEFTGMDTSGTNGSGAIVQCVQNSQLSGSANTTSITATLAAFGNSRNATYGAFGKGGATSNPTAGSGFGDEIDILFNSAIEGVTEFRADNDTTVDVTFSSDTELGIFGVEIKAGTAPVIDVTSGVNAGFSGSPDNTNPFTSGQAVSYTVQAALNRITTYYWRARAKAPSGTNTYGAWATTRSFTTLSRPKLEWT